MKHTHLLCCIVAILSMIGIFAYFLGNKSDQPTSLSQKQQLTTVTTTSTGVTTTSTGRTITPKKRKPCGCCDKERERMRKKILQARKRKQAQQKSVVSTETMQSD